MPFLTSDLLTSGEPEELFDLPESLAPGLYELRAAVSIRIRLADTDPTDDVTTIPAEIS